MESTSVEVNEPVPAPKTGPIPAVTNGFTGPAPDFGW